jgi:hypothetical protein
MNRSTLFAFEKIGCGRRNRTFIFEFKARCVAGYTIPQEVKFRDTRILTQKPRANLAQLCSKILELHNNPPLVAKINH